MLRPGRPFFIPAWDEEFRLYPMLALRIDHVGKGIPTRFVHRYIRQASMWLHARGMRTLAALTSAGAPLASALAFDSSVISAPFADMNLEQAKAISASMSISSASGQPDEERILQLALPETCDIEDLISSVASRNTLRTGDVFMLPLQDTGIEIAEGQDVEIKLLSPAAGKLLHFNIK